MEENNPKKKKDEPEHEHGNRQALGLPLGLCFGVAFGTVLDNLALGIALGLWQLSAAQKTAKTWGRFRANAINNRIDQKNMRVPGRGCAYTCV